MKRGQYLGMHIDPVMPCPREFVYLVTDNTKQCQKPAAKQGFHILTHDLGVVFIPLTTMRRARSHILELGLNLHSCSD